MKIKDKNIKKSVDNMTREYNKTLTKAIIDMMKLTGCRADNNFSFGKPIIFTSSQASDKHGIKVNSDAIVVNGLYFHEEPYHVPYLMATYDCEAVLLSIDWHPNDYLLIYKAVRKAVLAY